MLCDTFITYILYPGAWQIHTGVRIKNSAKNKNTRVKKSALPSPTVLQANYLSSLCLNPKKKIIIKKIIIILLTIVYNYYRRLSTVNCLSNTPEN